jgi:hypothetical protein
MVTIYEPRFEEGYQWAMPVGGSKPIRQLRHRQRGDPWTPLWMYRITMRPGEEVPSLREADMPWYGRNTLVLTPHARDALLPTLDGDVELLPLYCDEGAELWLAHAWRVVDALDEDRSAVRRFTNGDVMAIEKHAFLRDRIADLRCFRIPQVTTMFLTGEVVEAVQSAGLRGTRFRAVWHS